MLLLFQLSSTPVKDETIGWAFGLPILRGGRSRVFGFPHPSSNVRLQEETPGKIDLLVLVLLWFV